MQRNRPHPASVGDRSAAVADSPLAYVNSRGQTYYLHQGETKTGAPRYHFARTAGPGAIPRLPPGYEIAESVNGVVSVRRVPAGPGPIPPEHVEQVRAALRQVGLGRCRAEARKREIILYEPHGVPLETLHSLGFLHAGQALLPARFEPVMKFVRDSTEGEGPVHYTAHRMTYRGDGGWSHPLSSGPLATLLGRYLPHIGKDSFYELY